MTIGNVAIKRAPATDTADSLRGRDMLCFSHDWSGDPLSKTHLMRLMARENRVLWVNSIGYRTPTASKADLSRAFWKLAAAATVQSCDQLGLQSGGLGDCGPVG